MILFFYNFVLMVALVAGAPWWLWRMATTNKYREGLRERLGTIRPELLRYCQERRVRSPQGQRPQNKKRPLIWVHAVSVGEVLAVTGLVKALDAALPNYLVVLSTTTRTGQALARERFGADRVFYCPLDLPWAVRAYLNALQPWLLILAETEFWPNLLSGCFRRQIPIAVVNARISDRSWPRYRRLRRLWKPFLSRLSRVLAQSESDAERLKILGCPAQRLSVSGNLKFDARASEEAVATRLLRSLAHGLRFIVAGSTLDGEEAALVEAWPRLLAVDSQLILVLAPRHPERFAAVAALLSKSGLPWIRRSEWPADWPAFNRTEDENLDSHSFRQEREKDGAPKSIEPGPLQPGQIVLLDTIGELASVYSLAAVAFVGGSLTPAGGHNPLEPAQFGVPIVMGPHFFNFRAITEALIAAGALSIAAQEELPEVLCRLLQDRKAAAAMGEQARQLFHRQAGATARSVEAVQKLLAKNGMN
jgi:3-deoxy-D-manno-octulosonic-acid transferase